MVVDYAEGGEVVGGEGAGGVVGEALVAREVVVVAVGGGLVRGLIRGSLEVLLCFHCGLWTATLKWKGS